MTLLKCSNLYQGLDSTLITILKLKRDNKTLNVVVGGQESY